MDSQLPRPFKTGNDLGMDTHTTAGLLMVNGGAGTQVSPKSRTDDTSASKLFTGED